MNIFLMLIFIASIGITMYAVGKIDTFGRDEVEDERLH